ncbi:C-type lectin lectoxin-Phi1-like [Branchiostoma floridae x Branchiostoma japonicum]
MGRIPAILALLLGMVNGLAALSCVECVREQCDPVDCPAGVEADACGCCDVCLKTEGETCRGPWRIHGNCANGLTCVLNPNFPEDFNSVGTCRQGASKCPVGYVRAGSGCYKLVNTPSTYRAAEQWCSQNGGRLVTVKDKQTLQLMKKAARRAPRADVWIGLSDRVTEGTLTWSDDEPYKRPSKRTDVWAEGAARQNTAGNDCVYASTSDNYRWRIGNCADERMFICEVVLG